MEREPRVLGAGGESVPRGTEKVDDVYVGGDSRGVGRGNYGVPGG